MCRGGFGHEERQRDEHNVGGTVDLQKAVHARTNGVDRMQSSGVIITTVMCVFSGRTWRSSRGIAAHGADLILQPGPSACSYCLVRYFARRASGWRSSHRRSHLGSACAPCVPAVAGEIATSCVGPGLISVGLGTREPIAPRGKPHIIPGALHGRDFWYMWYARPGPVPRPTRARCMP